MHNIIFKILIDITSYNGLERWSPRLKLYMFNLIVFVIYIFFSSLICSAFFRILFRFLLQIHTSTVLMKKKKSDSVRRCTTHRTDDYAPLWCNWWEKHVCITNKIHSKAFSSSFLFICACSHFCNLLLFVLLLFVQSCFHDSLSLSLYPYIYLCRDESSLFYLFHICMFNERIIIELWKIKKKSKEKN